MVFYFVQKGETLYTIARRYQTTVHAIVSANRLADPNALSPGQALIIPRPGEIPTPPPGGNLHLVRQGETVFHLAERFGTTAHAILHANQLAHPEFILPGQQLVIPEPGELGEEWPMYGRGPGRTGASPVRLEGVPLPGWTYSPRKSIGALPSPPTVRYDRVYVALGDACYYCIDRHAGRVRWRLPYGFPHDFTDQPPPAPAVFEGIAYLCYPDGTVHGVDAHSGQPIWQLDVGGPITSSPAVSGGILYFGCWNGHVYGVETKTGAIAWKHDLGTAISEPVASGDHLLFAMDRGGGLHALDAHTGGLRWRVHLDRPASPIFAEVVLVCGRKGFDPESGQELWSADLPSAPAAVWIDQVICRGESVDLFTGAVRWAHPQLKEFIGWTVSGGQLIAVGDDQRLYALNGLDGALEWSLDLEGRARHAPAVAPGQLLLAMENGSLKSIRMKPQ